MIYFSYRKGGEGRAHEREKVVKSKKSYIKRFMKALRENEREDYKDIEVQVILNGEHVLEGGNYVIGGNAKVSIPNPWTRTCSSSITGSSRQMGATVKTHTYSLTTTGS